MQKLQKYAELSSIMNISLILEDGRFSFNLFKELQISEDSINLEATTQPSSYAFLSMLHKKLLKATDDRKLEMDKSWSQAYINAKREINPDTGRSNADDLAKAIASTSKSYLTNTEDYLDIKHKANILEACVRAFESRGSLIQTISANTRKEK